MTQDERLEKFWAKVDMAGPQARDGLGRCWLWLGRVDKQGYGVLSFAGRYSLSHRVSWSLANGDPGPGECVLHHCDRRTCIRPTHLFLGSRADNAADMVAKGRQARGSRIGRSKLTEIDVFGIRYAHTIAGATKAVLAEAFGTSKRNIQRILNRSRWAHAFSFDS